MAKNIQRIIQFVFLGITLALLITNFGKQGRFLGMPYDFTVPTVSKIKSRLWSPSDPEILKPDIFGWGYSINFGAIAAKLGLV